MPTTPHGLLNNACYKENILVLSKNNYKKTPFHSATVHTICFPKEKSIRARLRKSYLYNLKGKLEINVEPVSLLTLTRRQTTQADDRSKIAHNLSKIAKLWSLMTKFGTIMKNTFK